MLVKPPINLLFGIIQRTAVYVGQTIYSVYKSENGHAISHILNIFMYKRKNEKNSWGVNWNERKHLGNKTYKLKFVNWIFSKKRQIRGEKWKQKKSHNVGRLMLMGGTLYSLWFKLLSFLLTSGDASQCVILNYVLLYSHWILTNLNSSFELEPCILIFIQYTLQRGILRQRIVWNDVIVAWLTFSLWPVTQHLGHGSRVFCLGLVQSLTLWPGQLHLKQKAPGHPWCGWPSSPQNAQRRFWKYKIINVDNW